MALEPAALGCYNHETALSSFHRVHMTTYLHRQAPRATAVLNINTCKTTAAWFFGVCRDRRAFGAVTGVMCMVCCVGCTSCLLCMMYGYSFSYALSRASGTCVGSQQALTRGRLPPLANCSASTNAQQTQRSHSDPLSKT